jgi:hypothetical protein
VSPCDVRFDWQFLAAFALEMAAPLWFNRNAKGPFFERGASVYEFVRRSNMADIQPPTDMTKWMRWIARGIGLLGGAVALLFISGVGSEWLLKGTLNICQPALESGDPSQWNLCRQVHAAMGGWADEIEATPWPLEGTMLAGLMIVTLLGILIAWRREGIGGTLLAISAIALSLFSTTCTECNGLSIILTMGGPLLVAGILSLACWRRSEER